LADGALLSASVQKWIAVCETNRPLAILLSSSLRRLAPPGQDYEGEPPAKIHLANADFT
jgi:hypothetical protein